MTNETGKLYQPGMFDDSAGAIFSDCRNWRYVLWRIWDDTRPMLSVCGLNPSTADETQLDPTLRRVSGYAHLWGFGGFYMLNLFAWRATDPRDMAKQPEPIGKENDKYLAEYGNKSPILLAAWGAHKLARERAKQASSLWTVPLRCLEVNSDGSPKHPLYCAADLKPQPYTIP